MNHILFKAERLSIVEGGGGDFEKGHVEILLKHTTPESGTTHLHTCNLISSLDETIKNRAAPQFHSLLIAFFTGQLYHCQTLLTELEERVVGDCPAVLLVFTGNQYGSAAH